MAENENIEQVLKEAEELGEQMAEAYDEGFLNSLSKTNTKVVQAFKTRYEAIGYQLKYGLITEEEYYQKLATIRDMYFSRDSQEWHKYTAEIYDYKVGVLEDYKKAVEDNLNEVLKISRDKFAAIQKEQEGYSDKLRDYAGGIGFESREIYIGNYYPTGDPLRFMEYSLTDYEKEIEKLKTFNQSIIDLKEKAGGIDPETFETFFSELQNMSIDDAQILMNLLLESGEKDFKEYFALYKERNDLADQISASLFVDDAREVANELKTELEAVFGTVPEEFFEYGAQTGASFIEGFMGEIDAVMGEIQVMTDMGESEIGAPSETQSNVFAPVYYFYGDRNATSRTRMTAKNDALFIFMRGME